LPKGDVHKKKEVIQDVTLHDLDIANARPQVGCYSSAILAILLASWILSLLSTQYEVPLAMFYKLHV